MAARSKRPDEQERSFGISVGLVMAAFSGISWWKAHETRGWIFAAISVALLVPALTRPTLLRAPCAWWWKLARVLGWVNSRILLTAIYLVILTPAAIVMRLAGWDPLRRRAGSAATNWITYPQRQQDPKHYDRMY